MKALSDSAFTLVSHLSERLGPVTAAIDSMMDRLLGQQVAQACPGVWCTTQCIGYACGQYGCTWEEIDGYSPSTAACWNGYVNCHVTYYGQSQCPVY